MAPFPIHTQLLPLSSSFSMQDELQSTTSSFVRSSKMVPMMTSRGFASPRRSEFQSLWLSLISDCNNAHSPPIVRFSSLPIPDQAFVATLGRKNRPVEDLAFFVLRSEYFYATYEEPTPNSPPPPICNFPVISSRKSHQSPQIAGPRTETDPEGFSCHLKILSPPQQPHQKQQQHRPFNPDTDPTPMRRTAEPKSMPDAASIHQRLFDHHKDDPIRFSVLTRPTHTPKSSGDCISVSSAPSYAYSIVNCTLSSRTDNSSASSALFEGKPREDSGNNVFTIQLEKLYRNISTLESKIINKDADENDDKGRVLLHGRRCETNSEELDQQKWVKLIADHKQRLAELMHTSSLLEISLAASPVYQIQTAQTIYGSVAYPLCWLNRMVTDDRSVALPKRAHLLPTSNHPDLRGWPRSQWVTMVTIRGK
ncbi:hypothetical protein BJ138DRAFT_1237319 [Hygrophoropsis aurantiaca]|uniref:Uncharacterized protein n=1 Tax=Hygrophoropsis aurantiaca TaxID=72124 RepID=A0ACB7ZUL9_9AGAM|nr:hypothetical protein BJ138DRAFT_1237319 [Hygrophoropsis aurantiaca]